MPKKNPFKKLGKDIERGFNKNVAKPLTSKEAKQIFNKEIIPGLVSVGIPLTSTALSIAGQEFGIPPQITKPLSESIMKSSIPKKYQSKNPYVNTLANVIDIGVEGAISGDIDPKALLNASQPALNQLGKDLKGKPKKQPQIQQEQQPEPIDDGNYIIPNSYYDYIKSLNQPQQEISYTIQQPPQYRYTNPRLQELQPPPAPVAPAPIQPPLSSKTGIADNGDLMGDYNAMMGGGIKKRRGRPKKSSSINPALSQLIENTRKKKDKERNEMIYNLLKANAI